MNFYSHIGELILGSRFKRISERFLVDVAKIYKSQNIPFEPSWFSIFYLLDQNKQMSIGEIALKIDISQSAVSQMINVLIKRGLVQYAPSKNDKRIRLICFTDSGKSLLKQIKPIWRSLKKSLQETLNERENSVYLLPALDELEDALEEKSIYSRVLEDLRRRELGDVQLIPYDTSFRNHYKDLILSWFIENDSIQIPDFDFVNDPEKFARSQKGVIYFAVVKEEIIGCVVVVFLSSDFAEIVVFALEDHWRRSQIGKKILNDSIIKLKENGREHIQLTLSRKRVWEVKLFKEEGFLLDSLKSNNGKENFVNISLSLQKQLKKNR